MSSKGSMIPILSKRLFRRKETFGELLFGATRFQLSVNHDGVQILDLIDGKRSVNEIIASVESILPDERLVDTEARPEVHQFLDYCEQFGILQFQTKEQQNG